MSACGGCPSDMFTELLKQKDNAVTLTMMEGEKIHLVAAHVQNVREAGKAMKDRGVNAEVTYEGVTILVKETVEEINLKGVVSLKKSSINPIIDLSLEAQKLNLFLRAFTDHMLIYRCNETTKEIEIDGRNKTPRQCALEAKAKLMPKAEVFNFKIENRTVAEKVKALLFALDVPFETDFK